MRELTFSSATQAATTNSSGTRVPAQASHAAWQREMEKAQMQNWFQPTQMATAPTVAQVNPPATTTAVQALPVAANAVWDVNPAALPLMPSDVSAALPQATGQGAAMPAALQLKPQAAGAVAVAVAVAPVEVPVRTLTQLQAWLRTGPSSAQAISPPFESTTPAGLRMHAEWSAQGQRVKIWLGLDGTPESIEQNLAWLLPQLRRTLNQQGVALESLMCNGQEVSLDAPPQAMNPDTPAPRAFTFYLPEHTT